LVGQGLLLYRRYNKPLLQRIQPGVRGCKQFVGGTQRGFKFAAMFDLEVQAISGVPLFYNIKSWA
jgi:hypothetical protein